MILDILLVIGIAAAWYFTSINYIKKYNNIISNMTTEKNNIIYNDAEERRKLLTRIYDLQNKLDEKENVDTFETLVKTIEENDAKEKAEKLTKKKVIRRKKTIPKK